MHNLIDDYMDRELAKAQANKDLIRNLIARLEKEIEFQTRSRGDMLDYGHPDELLVECKELLERLS
jgi:hypothetical protein